MKTINTIQLAVGLILFSSVLSSCTKEEIDTEYPTIDVIAADAFPRNCSEMNRGETFTARIIVADNQELGALSIDIHHNFDHHTHSTEIDECAMAPIKDAVNPFTTIESISIPEGLKEYTATKDILIPADVDTGDYHFTIRLTDKEGWQTIKGLSIKVK